QARGTGFFGLFNYGGNFVRRDKRPGRIVNRHDLRIFRHRGKTVRDRTRPRIAARNDLYRLCKTGVANKPFGKFQTLFGHNDDGLIARSAKFEFLKRMYEYRLSADDMELFWSICAESFSAAGRGDHDAVHRVPISVRVLRKPSDLESSRF